MNDQEELAEKYHKLFQDFTRIKAQHAVLKKAVLKEQTENAAMQTALKEKEQEVRKSLQDLDLLSFHNQRLTKRIENLQSQASTKSGGSWLMGGGSVKKELEKSQTTLEAATVDLQGKIEENEKLHQQLYEINALYPRHVTELQSKIQALEKQNQELQLDVERAGVANEDTITLIRKEKDAMEKELRTIRDVLAGQLQDEQRSNQSLHDNVQRLEHDIERLSKVEVELESLQGEHAKLQGELETLKWISSELSQLQQAYSNLERDKAHMEKAHAQLSQQHANLKQAEEGLKKILAQEREAVKTAQEQNRHLTSELDTVRGEAADRDRGHTSRIEQLELELGKVRKEQDKLRLECEDLKSAEQSAKEDESRTKATQALDLSKMESSLQEAEARVKELEGLKETLEQELSRTKALLIETSVNPPEHETDSAATGAAEHADHVTGSREAEIEVKSHDELGSVKEEDAVDKTDAPLSKKAKKRKAAAAAAAASAAAAVKKSDKAIAAEKEEDIEESGLRNTDGHETKSGGNSAAVAVAVAKDLSETRAQEAAHNKQEQERMALVDSLRSEVESLRAQIATFEQAGLSKHNELSAAHAALEAVKDEKDSISNSLVMHVELTMQLQQEIEELKAELVQKQTAKSPAVRNNLQVDQNRSQEEPYAKTRQSSVRANSVDNDFTLNYAEASVPPSGEDKRDHMVPAKDESTQVDKVEVLDKAVQAEEVEGAHKSALVDTAADAATTEASANAAKSSEEAKVIAEVKDRREKTGAVEDGQLLDKKTSRQSYNGTDAEMMKDMSTSDATSQLQSQAQSQSNREYLIKKHYETKIQNIAEQLQQSDGRYARLHKEFDLLRGLLMDTVQERNAAKGEAEQLRLKTVHLQEELSSAKEDYRAQVETMTNFMKSLDQKR